MNNIIIRKIGIVCCLLLTSFFSFSQSESLDKMLISLADSILFETEQTAVNHNIEKTVEQSLKALALSTNASYCQGIVRSYYIVGRSLFLNQSYNEALLFLSHVDGVKDHAMYPIYMSQIYMLKGQIYTKLDVLNHAQLELFKALETAEAIDEIEARTQIVSSIYHSLSTLYNRKGDS